MNETQVERTFDRRTGELNGSRSGSARFTLLLRDYGNRSIILGCILSLAFLSQCLSPRMATWHC